MRSSRVPPRYQDIANLAIRVQADRRAFIAAASRVHGGGQHPSRPPPPSASPAKRGGIETAAELAYAALVIAALYSQRAAIEYVLPRSLDSAAAFALFAWAAAWYSFDYVWGAAGVTLPRRLERVERNAAYHAGFGAPSAALLHAAPSRELGAGLYYVSFPLSILLAVAAAEAGRGGGGGVGGGGGSDGGSGGKDTMIGGRRHRRVPVFLAATFGATRMLRWFRERKGPR